MPTHTIMKNPDPEFCRNFKKRLKANSGYCPNAMKKTPDTKCQCKEFRTMIEQGIPGWCDCGMYCVTFDESGD